jgi:hypothetical protein
VREHLLTDQERVADHTGANDNYAAGSGSCEPAPAET